MSGRDVVIAGVGDAGNAISGGLIKLKAYRLRKGCSKAMKIEFDAVCFERAVWGGGENRRRSCAAAEIGDAALGIVSSACAGGSEEAELNFNIAAQVGDLAGLAKVNLVCPDDQILPDKLNIAGGKDIKLDGMNSDFIGFG